MNEKKSNPLIPLCIILTVLFAWHDCSEGHLVSGNVNKRQKEKEAGVLFILKTVNLVKS